MPNIPGLSPLWLPKAAKVGIVSSRLSLFLCQRKAIVPGLQEELTGATQVGSSSNELGRSAHSLLLLRSNTQEEEWVKSSYEPTSVCPHLQQLALVVNLRGSSINWETSP